MTKKDYVKIAAVLNETRPEKDTPILLAGWRAITGHIADMLAADNPRFDRARFLKACGMEV